MENNHQKMLAAYISSSSEGAEELYKKVQANISVDDAEFLGGAILTWLDGHRKPASRHLEDVSDSEILDITFWGMLFGLLFYIPEFGMATAAAAGSLSGVFLDEGISRSFMQQVQENLVEGSSALFLLANEAALEQVTERARQASFSFEIITTSISEEELAKLTKDFGP